MKMFSASTKINAPSEKIWGILTDSSKYTEWDPGIISLDGKIAEGEKLTIYAKVSPKRAFKVTVVEFNENRKMAWSSGMPLGLFKGIRTFTLEPLKNGVVNFKLQEVFSGPMLAMIGGSIPDMNPIFAEFVAGLKKRAEGA